MSEVKQEYEGSAGDVEVKSNYPNKRLSLSVPRTTTINVKVGRNKKHRLFVELDKLSAKEEG